jgi:hypothetical protein
VAELRAGLEPLVRGGGSALAVTVRKVSLQVVALSRFQPPSRSLFIGTQRDFLAGRKAMSTTIHIYQYLMRDGYQYLMRDGITHGCGSTESPSHGWDLGPSVSALRSEVLRDNAETQRTALLQRRRSR